MRVESRGIVEIGLPPKQGAKEDGWIAKSLKAPVVYSRDLRHLHRWL